MGGWVSTSLVLSFGLVVATPAMASSCSELLAVILQPRVLSLAETVQAVEEMLDDLAQIRGALNYENLKFEGNSVQPWATSKDVRGSQHLQSLGKLYSHGLKGQNPPTFIAMLEKGHNSVGLEEVLKDCRKRKLPVIGASLLAGAVGAAALYESTGARATQLSDDLKLFGQGSSVLGLTVASGFFVDSGVVYFMCPAHAQKTLLKNYAATISRIDNVEKELKKILAAAQREIKAGVKPENLPIHDVHRLLNHEP